MGRSVNYLSRAAHVAYFDVSYMEDSYEWDDFKDNITSALTDKYPSLSEETRKWDNNETQIILENTHCEIGLSEYCGLASLSIRVYESDYNWDKLGLAAQWIDKVWPNMLSLLRANVGADQLSRIGTFSNGESIYQKCK